MVRDTEVGSENARDGDANIETGSGTETEILKRDASSPPLVYQKMTTSVVH